MSVAAIAVQAALPNTFDILGESADDWSLGADGPLMAQSLVRTELAGIAPAQMFVRTATPTVVLGWATVVSARVRNLPDPRLNPKFCSP